MRQAQSPMLRLSLRSIMAHKVRLLLTVLAVVLGTAFVSGSFMFTASLNKVFDSAVSTAFDGVSAVISPQGENGLEAITPENVEKLRSDSKISTININQQTTIVAANTERKPFQTGAGSSIVSIFYGEKTVTGGLEITQGTAPTASSEVVIGQDGAQRYGISIGDTIVAVTSDAQHELMVTGFYAPQIKEQSAASAASLNFRMTEQAYLEEFGDPNRISSLVVRAAEGVTDDELVNYLQQEYPDLQIQSGQSLADELSDQVSSALSFVNYFLIAFGLIALLVGTFIIANTFSMIVAQRIREFALLRAVGVSSRQLTTSVVWEAIVVGIIGSLLGVLAGIGLVQIIQSVMANFGMPLNDAGLGLTPVSVLIPLLLGTIVTLISAWAPAYRAGSVHPVEAMRSTEQSSESSLLVRTIIGTVGIVLGAGIIVLAVIAEWSTSVRASAVGMGALLVIIGIFFASPALSIPIVGGIGRVIGLPFKTVGQLAATNSRRNPRRTATTAFALTLGVMLVTAIGLLAASMRAEISDLVETEISADYIVTPPRDGQFPVPKEAITAIRDTEGVEQAAVISAVPVSIDGYYLMTVPGAGGFSSIIDGNAGDVLHASEITGSLDLSRPNVFIANKQVAEKQGWQLGQSYPVLGAQGEQLALVELIGTYGDSQLLGQFQISAGTLVDTTYYDTAKSNLILVTTDHSVDAQQMHDRLEATIKDYLILQLNTAEEYAGQQVETINQMMYILYALLALSIIIAVIGIINTLALNVIERRQEIGMLRAVGMHRRQIRTMITIESVQIAIYGALVGIIAGLGLGTAFLKVLSSQGISQIIIPWTSLIWMLIAAALVGVIAALAPAQRAAKTPPLDAIAD
ncbi:ABC transporter permease protein [Corynebacterium kutscheri]|uniref:ABC transporter permease protein n=2 Tax=Corynebacterium kutscheri TaxID=35755 RepID=A0AB38VR71_9CORY|nr:ABC transporter permease protein [Corynebacterium kutscheri]